MFCCWEKVRKKCSFFPRGEELHSSLREKRKKSPFPFLQMKWISLFKIKKKKNVFFFLKRGEQRHSQFVNVKNFIPLVQEANPFLFLEDMEENYSFPFCNEKNVIFFIRGKGYGNLPTMNYFFQWKYSVFHSEYGKPASFLCE